MNVLFVTYDFPYPTTSGGKNRAYHLLKHTAQKVNIFLYSFVRDDYNPDFNNEILSLGVKKIKVFKRKKLSDFSNIPKTVVNNSSIFKTLYFSDEVLADLTEIIDEEKIDVVHYESSYTGYYIEKFKRKKINQILGTENIEYQLYFDFARSMKQFYLRPFVSLQAQQLKKEELGMVRNADAVTTITKSESDTLKQITGIEPHVIANGIEPNIFSHEFSEELKNNILFVGNFTYFPNIDAVDFFYKEVFPKLDKKITLTIVGKKCNEKFKFVEANIIRKDFVTDIVEEYRKADILVFPIRIGGGTNFKVLEAMSLGIPIIAHPDRLSGLDAVEGKHFLPATSGEEYNEQIKRLYSDQNLRRELSVNARRLVESRFAWAGIGKELMSVWKKA